MAFTPLSYSGHGRAKSKDFDYSLLFMMIAPKTKKMQNMKKIYLDFGLLVMISNINIGQKQNGIYRIIEMKIL